MAESSQTPNISPVARERARLRDQARNRIAANPRARRTQLDFVQDTEAQDEAPQETTFEDAQEPFQTDLEQEAGLLSVKQLLDVAKFSESDFGEFLFMSAF